MSEYVPSDEDVYGVWTNYQCFGADDGYGPRGVERAAAEMDRYIARVRREAKAEALRDAADSVHDNAASPYCLPCHRDDADLLHTIATEYETGDSDEHR